jgi:hypothetical protein
LKKLEKEREKAKKKVSLEWNVLTLTLTLLVESPACVSLPFFKTTFFEFSFLNLLTFEM